MSRRKRFETVTLRGRDVRIRLQLSRRARHITLRLDEKRGGVDLVLPRGVPRAEGLQFAQEKAGWILRHIDSLPSPVPFAHGSVIPVMGKEYEIFHRPNDRGVVWVEDSTLCVAGDAPHVARRVTDWLKKTARREISWRAHANAERTGRGIERISFRDPRSRWGSCSDDGHLSFSWRLVLAPAGVLEYVVAHEVAHLTELNHSPRFWALVHDLCPDCDVPKYWLKRHGATLHRFG